MLDNANEQPKCTAPKSFQVSYLRVLSRQTRRVRAIITRKLA
jgi:hypothetical protein